MIAKKIQDIELARAEVPTAKKEAAGVPDSVSGAEHLEKSIIAGLNGRIPIHRSCLLQDCLYVNIITGEVTFPGRFSLFLQHKPLIPVLD